MNVDCSILANQCLSFKSGNNGYLRQANRSALLEIATCGIGRTVFSFESDGDVIPRMVYFEDGSSLRRQDTSTSWLFVKDCVEMPWHGEVYVNDQKAIISAGAVADLFNLDGSHIRYLNDKIVMLVTMCGDVFEFDYADEILRTVELNGKSYIQWRHGKWQLASTKIQVCGVPEVSVRGFSFDARVMHGYFDKYLTNGNLTTMRDGVCKFTFGAARI